MRKPALIGLLIFLLLAASARAQDDGVIIDSVRFEGNDALKDSELLAVMESKTPPAWKIWESPPKLSPAALSRDKRSIIRLYKANGYYSVKVEIKVEKEKGLARLTVVVSEGEPVTIRTIDLALTPADESLRRTLLSLPSNRRFKPGVVFRLGEYAQFKANILRYLAAGGRPAAKLEARVNVSASQGWADIRLSLDPGPVLAMGEASFEGHERTRLAVLAREVSWKPGQRYDVRYLEETKRRLLALGVFSSVKISPQLDKIADGRVPIKVVLVERTTYSVSFGLGYGTEDMFRARATGYARSVFGLAEVISATAHYSGRAKGGLVSYRQPHFLARQQFLDLRLGHHNREEVSFSNQRSFGQIRITRPVKGPISATVGYTLEVDRPYNIETARTPEDAETHWVSSLTAGLTTDTRDDVLDPTTGFLFNVRGEIAPGFIGSEVEFLQLESSYRHYYTPRSWLTLAFLLRVVAVRPIGETDDVPIFKRLFAGGSKSIRGYPYQMLGPLDDEGRPLGGERLIEASLEGRFPVWGPLKGVVFTDTGQVADDAYDFGQTRFRYTAGVGLRYKTVIGPIRLDIGYQLNPPENADFERYHFHFSIGQAF